MITLNYQNDNSYYITEIIQSITEAENTDFLKGGTRLHWYKLPAVLLQVKLPYSAVILACILYDTDRNGTCQITVKQREIAKKMNTSACTINRGMRQLKAAGIIVNYKSNGDATEIELKPGIVPPRQASGQAKRKAQPQQPSNSSINMDDIDALINQF